MKTSSRILLNTSAQYVRSIANMLFSLIATRIILKTLGVEDYGIYTLIAGIISLLAFVTNALVVTTQRFFSVAQGSDDKNRLSVVFNTSIFLHVGISLIIVFILELSTGILFNGFLNISSERIDAAQKLYHSTVVILFLSFISAPFKATIVSHENIVYASIIEILVGLLKVCIAAILPFIRYDHLIMYGYLLVFIFLFELFAWILYACSRYEECRKISFSLFRISVVKDILQFAGWTMYSIGCVTGRSQGIAVILNKFMGTIVNSAYGLSLQVSGAIISLSQSLLNAVNPQLMKSEGSGDRVKMFRYAAVESKFAFFLLSALVIPCVFEMPRLLELWLGDVPKYAVFFCRIVLVANCMDMLTIGLNAANQAIGDIKKYTILIYSLKLSTLFFVILGFYLGCPFLLLGISYIGMELITSIIRIPYLVKSGGLEAKQFVIDVFVPEIIPLCVFNAACLLITTFIECPFRFILTFIVPIVLFFVAIYLWGLSASERNIIEQFAGRIVKGTGK